MATKKTKRGARRTAARSRARSRTRKVAPVPPRYGSVTPYLTIDGCGSAIDFYVRAFGAKEIARMPGPGGKVMHAELEIGDSVVMMSDELPEQGTRSPRALGGTAGSIMLYVKDCDRIYRNAVDAGARSLQAPQDMFWGDRFSRIEDPYGHQWAIATAKEKVSPKEMQRRMAAMQAGGAPPAPPSGE
jgi:PhnB protein